MNIDNNDQKENPDEETTDNDSDGLPHNNVPDSEPSDGENHDGAVTLEEGAPNQSNAEDGDEPAVESEEPTYEELQSEVATIKDQLLRSLAEGENIRRRTEREKADMSKYATTNFAREIISVADNLTRALGSVSDDARTGNEELNNLCQGIEMTDKELANTFEKFNIQLINSIGQKFDHNIHQAMFEVDDPEQPAGMVVQEIQKGYVLHDRLLRPAMVGVSKGGPKLEITEKTPPIAEPAKEKVANESSSAYEKQSDAVNQAAEGNSGQLDKEL
jgi:molecular chaperone GrpE